MKTTFTFFIISMFTAFFLISSRSYAQFTHFPTAGAPIFGKAPVAKGNLDDPDKNIWVKVNGKIVGPQPHNKMHPYVTPGSAVDINFNINKAGNRYTLVSYSVDSVTGKRTIYDYQSNFYNATKPVQGNSNQQLVLIPTCKFEVYFIKGTLVTDFTLAPNAALTASGPAGNPYATDPAGNLVLDFAYGGTGTCETCPTVINTTDCVFPRLLEVIDRPATQEKELIFSVINNINTNTNACGTGWPEIGDIVFTNIYPSHTSNNQPYQFRYNYQLGPHIPAYPLSGVTPPLPNNYQGSFVFDQRNNHNVLDFDVYQSEIVRFRVPNTEYARLSSPSNTVIPQICVELSNKHPEPHKTLPPVYCADIDFVCEPPMEEVCTADSTNNFIAQIPTEFENDLNNNFQVPVRIVNLTGAPVSEVDITLGPAPLPISGPQSGSYSEGNFTWNVTNDGVSNVTFSSLNTAGFVNGASEDLILTINADDLLNSGGVLSIAITAGGITETLELEAAVCAIIVPLPVELLHFKGKATENGIVLTWKTASEKANDHFEIQRSTNGLHFEKIGLVKGAGNSATLLAYSFLDTTPAANLQYYRLKQTDTDGSSSHSPIIQVSTDRRIQPLSVQFMPNPCGTQHCSIKLNEITNNNTTTLMLRDLTGRIVLRKTLAGNEHTYEIPKNGLDNGIYILSAQNGTHTAYQKIIIQ